MLSLSSRNPVAHNQQAKLALDYNELLKELSSHKLTSVGCYTIGETIGEGTFGKVSKGTHKLTGKLVSIKKISKQHAPMMAREIHHHKQIKHPNVVMLYEMITTESSIHIISEYCPNGDLLDALTLAGGRCSETRVHKWFHQLTDAISYCHSQHIVHRDLKLENILLDADDNVKVCDFGFARFTQKNQYLETFCGSPSYSAPEIILRKKYTGPETDIWSLGVILYTLLSGEFPFDDDSEVITQRKIVQVDYQIPYYFSSKLSNLIHGMLQFEPSHRFTMDTIMNHAWMTEIEDDMLEEDLTPSSSTNSNGSSITDIEPFVHHISSPSLFQPFQQNKPTQFSTHLLDSHHKKYTTNIPPKTFLPPSFSQKTQGMSVTEQRLFTALLAAGFDRDALVKMRSGECDTSSTLWHLLLENMTVKSPPSSDQLDFAVKEQTNKPTKAVDCAVQTSPVMNEESIHSQIEPCDIKPYPKPTRPPAIQTVGFGSTTTVTIEEQRSGWFSSVKSWFGSKPQPTFPASNYSIDIKSEEDDIIMSPPIYRTGSQKYRRKAIQLAEPPVNELDRLTYNNTTITNKDITHHKVAASSTHLNEPNQPSFINVPPAALTSGVVTDTFSILSDDTAKPKEVNICQKHYSMMHTLQQQPTPPPSPPVWATTAIKKSEEYMIPSPVMSPIEESMVDLSAQKKPPIVLPSLLNENKVEKPLVTQRTLSTAQKPSLPSSRFNFAPRSRLSAYGVQESKNLPISKTIIEEEEE
ncbi:hypothetical protein G6F24_002976 [Rhizopus arrhizus]|nr:hypothetical protein G6F24_002976 [Rhizopus arrhizus]